MKTIITLFFVGFFTSISYAQVGIGTTSPTQEIDIVGNARVRGLSNANNLILDVYAQPDGTLVTSLNNANVPGARFIGLIDTDIALDTDMAFFEIILGTEYLDILNEYDTTSGRYTPAINGKYKILISFDLGEYLDTYYDIDILIGLWDFTDNNWVSRRTFGHKSQNRWPGRNEAYNCVNYVDLDSTHSYGFRILPTYNLTSYFGALNLTMKALNSGSTGDTSISTTFAIEKVN